MDPPEVPAVHQKQLHKVISFLFPDLRSTRNFADLSPTCESASAKRRRTRTNFSGWQLEELESAFEVSMHNFAEQFQIRQNRRRRVYCVF